MAIAAAWSRQRKRVVTPGTGYGEYDRLEEGILENS